MVSFILHTADNRVHQNDMEEDKNNNMDMDKSQKMKSYEGVIGKKEGLYNKQKQILHNDKQWVSELIKPLHYKIQL